MMRAHLFGGRRRDTNNDSGGGVLMIVGLVFIILSPIFAQLIQLAISRRREYLADASGALLTRYPEGLANALEKIKQENQPLRSANRATAHMYIANPFGKMRGAVAGLFSTHPPIDDRIKQLRTMGH
jgi:heat shock protein HtpX